MDDDELFKKTAKGKQHKSNNFMDDPNTPAVGVPAKIKGKKVKKTGGAEDNVAIFDYDNNN